MKKKLLATTFAAMMFAAPTVSLAAPGDYWDLDDAKNSDLKKEVEETGSADITDLTVSVKGGEGEPKPGIVRKDKVTIIQTPDKMEFTKDQTPTDSKWLVKGHDAKNTHWYVGVLNDKESKTEGNEGKGAQWSFTAEFSGLTKVGGLVDYKNDGTYVGLQTKELYDYNPGARDANGEFGKDGKIAAAQTNAPGQPGYLTKLSDSEIVSKNVSFSKTEGSKKLKLERQNPVAIMSAKDGSELGGYMTEIESAALYLPEDKESGDYKGQIKWSMSDTLITVGTPEDIDVTN